MLLWHRLDPATNVTACAGFHAVDAPPWPSSSVQTWHGRKASEKDRLRRAPSQWESSCAGAQSPKLASLSSGASHRERSPSPPNNKRHARISLRSLRRSPQKARDAPLAPATALPGGGPPPPPAGRALRPERWPQPPADSTRTGLPPGGLVRGARARGAHPRAGDQNGPAALRVHPPSEAASHLRFQLSILGHPASSMSHISPLRHIRGVLLCMGRPTEVR